MRVRACASSLFVCVCVCVPVLSVHMSLSVTGLLWCLQVECERVQVQVHGAMNVQEYMAGGYEFVYVCLRVFMCV